MSRQDEARDFLQWLGDPEHRGVSSLRKLKADTLRETVRPVMIHHQAQPIAVLIPYQRFMEWQDLCASLEALTRRERGGV